MKSFLFENIWLLSHQDQRARMVEFHPRKNLIVGRNHTGKSSVIKTLFRTLGARPQGELAQWDQNTISMVTFNIDQRKFRVVHQQGHRALFSEKNELIVASSNHEDWSQAFADAVGFNLVLTDKNLATVPADARCFFLPFYINQDGSWQAGWDTFVGLQQYKNPTRAILDYFSGIKPPEYYEVHSKHIQLQHKLDELQKEQHFLGRARERFGKAMSLSGPKVDASNFEQDIARLTTEVTILNQLQETLRDQAVREQELISSINMQINLAVEALGTYDRDSNYLRVEPSDSLVCPTCGAEHAESFLDVLTYAEDARVLRELVARLRKEAIKAVKEYRNTQDKLGELQTNYRRVSEVLDTRRGELKFGDVVNSMGAESAFKAFEQETTELKKEIDQRLSEIEVFSTRLKELANPKRTKDILKIFREAYAAALIGLNLPPINTERLTMLSRPDLSGSGGPRSILAYYAALWQTCRGAYGSFSIPLIIDAPQQQGQDDINLPKVLKFIANDLPKDAQVLVGIEMETEHVFDKKIEFSQPYKLLQEDEFENVGRVVTPLTNAMYEALSKKEADSKITAV